jgi:TRAP-type mannitol/chloroaromatic compound transport system permease small subunit
MSAPALPASLRLYVRWVDRLSDGVGLVAMYLIFVMIAVLLADSAARNAGTFPIHWAVELAQFCLAAYYFSGGAKTLKDGEHVRMDLLYGRLSARGKARLDLITSVCLIFFLCVLLFGAISSTRYAIETNQRNFSMWNPSMIPIKVIMSAGVVLMLLQAVSLVVKDWAKLTGRAVA